jgi:N-acetylglutamate synthase-like GNAT family acetyltransferase
MQFRFLQPGSIEFQKGKMLRWEVLGKSLGVSPEMLHNQEDMNGLHLVAMDKKLIIGCVCFSPEEKTSGRIFQLVVSEEYQGKGFGRRLLGFLEKSLVDRGIESVYLYAQKEVECFYMSLGYQKEEQVKQEMGTEHLVMRKRLL